jgi:hypothetical protein
MKVLGILSRKFIPCTVIKLRLQSLRSAKKKDPIVVRQRKAFSTRCRPAIHYYLLRFLGLIRTAYDHNQADVRATA